ncbi:hypothetical protein ABW20_dc0100322 [Dactylellina cionopaga]|nr:hypothetical protein ABW20_dc0100322 [Dactylellina cionopaga]
MYLAMQTLRSYRHSIPTTDLEDDPRDREGPPELLLLLATTNADKAPAPASYEHRLVMMCLLAEEIRDVFIRESKWPVTIDVAITPHARFIDKSADLAAHELYPKETTRQIWTLGHDTLVRLLNPKYYPPEHNLEPVYTSLLSSSNRILIFSRPSDEFGAQDLQREYYDTLDKRALDKLDRVESDGEMMAGVSSTKVRRGAKAEIVDGVRNVEGWRGAVCEGVAGYIVEEGLYR